MATIVQLSDVHLEAYEGQQRETIDPLVEGLGLLRATRSRAPDLLVITGDVFDNATIPVEQAVPIAQRLLARIDEALGREMPAVILPGNHDRRVQGLLGPHRRALFDGLRAGLGDRVHVAGCDTPFLAEVIPRAFHGLAANVACLDSTFVPTGLISAGGVLRQEDLLEVADLLSEESHDEPVIVVTHHHLIPTPLTDLSRIDTDTKNRVLQWLAKNVLAGLISNADHEEWMMTALGAGTALSTLHALERALVVLHGHKHYPTIRALRGTADTHGDVMLVAAGSSGLVLSFDAAHDADSAHLWPSFNVIDLEGPTLAVDSVAFSPMRPTHPEEQTRLATRPLVRATRQGARWQIDPVPPEPGNAGPVLSNNEATYRLIANSVRPRALWDFEVERVVRYGNGPALDEYIETVDAAPSAYMTDLRIGNATHSPLKLPAPLHLPIDGTMVFYRVTGGLCRSLEEVLRAYGPLDAFEWVDLLNRYQSQRCALVLEGLPNGARAFGSAIDLTSGQERPVRVVRDGPRAVLAIEECPPRTLLRILWRPDR